jgi:hypothetical protein
MSPVWYGLSIPFDVREIGNIGTEVSLYTYLHVREDAMLLYGLFTEDERSLFRLLLVTGIAEDGPGILRGYRLRTPLLHRGGKYRSATTIPALAESLPSALS